MPNSSITPRPAGTAAGEARAPPPSQSDRIRPLTKRPPDAPQELPRPLTQFRDIPSVAEGSAG